MPTPRGLDLFGADISGQKVSRLIDWLINPLSTADRIALGATLGPDNAGLASYDIQDLTLYTWTGTVWGSSVTSVLWGTIGGLLSNQTDLQSALNAKQNVLGFTPVPDTRTLTINGVTQDLTADRSWSVPVFTLTNGSGTTANGTAVDLGGSTSIITNVLTTTFDFNIKGTSGNIFLTENDGAGNLASLTIFNGSAGISAQDTSNNNAELAVTPAGASIAYNDGVVTNFAVIGVSVGGKFQIKSQATGSHANGEVLTLIDNSTGEVQYAPIPSAPVLSVFTRTGAVVAQSGDYNTSQVTENTNLYFTNARAIAAPLTGYVSGAGVVAATDSILQAIQKLNGNISALVTGVSSFNTRTGAITLTSGDVTGALGFTPYNATNPAGYISGNQTITLSGEASGSGATSIAVTLSNAAVIGKVLTGYVSGAGVVAATDSLLQAIQKLNGNITALTTGVSSVFGRTGAVTAQSGDYSTNLVTENTNLYFTNARAIAALLTGYVSGAGVVAATDSILQAIQKLNGNTAALITGVSSVFGRTGAVTAQSGDYTTAQVTESGNLYYTNARGIGSVLTGYVSGAGTVVATDTILQAIQKLNGNTAALITGVSSVNSLTGAVALTGTANRITISGANVFDISAAYVGQSSITTLGTITTGIWNGTAIANANLANSTITINGASTSLGGSVTITTTGTANRISVATGGGLTPTIDISAAYVGQASITTLGTITTGTLGTGAIIGGVTMTLGSDAANDVYYRNSSGVLTRLANGTTGQYLGATTGAAPAWGTPAGTTYTFSTGLSGTTTITNNLSTGIAGGQTVIGGILASQNLILTSTNNATKGVIYFGSAQTSFFNESNTVLQIRKDGITSGPSTGDGIYLTNLTAANVATFEASPTLTMEGQSWSTGSGGATKSMKFYWQVIPTTNQAAGGGSLTLWRSIGAGLTQQIFGIDETGTITSGIWHGTIVGSTYGGTGVNNGSSLITIGGNVTFSGAFAFTGTLTNTTSVTFPTAGTLMTLDQIETVTGAKTFNAGKAILGAGSTSNASLVWTPSGASLKTSPAAGDMEVDANGLQYYTHATGERGVEDSEQFISLTATYTLASQTALQKIFNSTTNGALTLAASTSYFFECYFDVSGLSSTSSTFSFGFGGTATFTSLKYFALAAKVAALTTPSATLLTTITVATSSALISGSTNTIGTAKITGIVRVNTGGTIIPSIGMSIAAAGVIGVNSYFRIWPVGTNTVTNVGNWS